MTLPFPDAEIARVMIGDIDLFYRKADAGGTHYLQRVHFEEFLSPIYRLLARELAPAACLDIGANYGYTGLLMRRHFPGANLTLVEPVPWLEPFIRHNFDANGSAPDRLLSAIVTSGAGAGRARFGVNERGTQDSRVVPQPGAQVIETDAVTMDQLLADVGDQTPTYIKIDTQGWEEHVFAGGECFLHRNDRWFIKTEFAPKWLESQGTDPVMLLRGLIADYAVHESPGRERWNCASLAEAIGTELAPGCEADFTAYVRNLAINDNGWIDLYVLPPLRRRHFARAPRGLRRLFG